jgi:hypothetical protein
MWEQYKRSFWGVQAGIVAIEYTVFVNTHRWSAVAVFFLTMQLASLLGARWAVRLKRKIERAALPG